MTTFSQLGLAPELLKALEGEGYSAPTPIQAQAIPPVMAGRDLLGIAQTGTGKTAAFALPILHRLAENRRPAPRRGCRALILSPTRELATQIAESFRAYGRHLDMTVAVVFGGVAPRPQIQALSRGVDVLVATPGRLLDHMGARAADLSGTEIFVLDEADQMLDLGFVKPIRRIVSELAHRRQNLFFSATMPNEISGLANELLREPIKVAVTPVATTAERVSQRVILIEASKKRSLLVELLAAPDMTRTLVFTRTKRGADRVAKHLEGAGIPAAAIHGNKSQRQREGALEDFRTSRVSVLVATDIAARGIDINLVSHVVNFELPEVPEAYVHRIGRTARAGASGTAISLCDNEERDLLRAIERTTRQQIPHEDRRGDTTLAVAARIETRERDPRSERHRRPEGRSDGRRDGDRRGGRPMHSRSGDRAPAQPRDGERRNEAQGAHVRRDNPDRPQRADRTERSDRPHHRDDARQDRGGASAHRAAGPGRPDGRAEGRPDRARGNDRAHQPDRRERTDRAEGGQRRDNGNGKPISGVAFLKRSSSGNRGNARPSHAGSRPRENGAN